MRRSLVTILAVLSISVLVACSSSDETTTSSSSTTNTTAKATASSVAVAAADAQICADVQAYATARGEVPELTGGMTEANATALKDYLISLEPLVTAIQTSAPPELASWVTATQTASAEVKAVDVTVEADRQKLGTLVLYPTPEAQAANKTFGDFAATRCGVDVP